MTKVAEPRQIGDTWRIVKPGTQDPLINADNRPVDGGGYKQPNFATQRAADINRYYEGLLRQHNEGADE